MNKRLLLIPSIFAALFISGCTLVQNPIITPIVNFLTTDKINKVTSIGQATNDIVYELFYINKNISKPIIVTSIVNVNDIKQTSNFGRLFSDSLLTDFRRKYSNIIEIKGHEAVEVNKNGEFYLSKEILSKYPSNSFVVVGTYANYQNGILVNIRILSTKTNSVISASNIHIIGEDILELAKADNCKNLECKKENENISKFPMRIIKDDCPSSFDCKE